MNIDQATLIEDAIDACIFNTGLNFETVDTIMSKVKGGDLSFHMDTRQGRFFGLYSEKPIYEFEWLHEFTRTSLIDSNIRELTNTNDPRNFIDGAVGKENTIFYMLSQRFILVQDTSCTANDIEDVLNRKNVRASSKFIKAIIDQGEGKFVPFNLLVFTGEKLPLSHFSQLDKLSKWYENNNGKLFIVNGGHVINESNPLVVFKKLVNNKEYPITDDHKSLLKSAENVCIGFDSNMEPLTIDIITVTPELITAAKSKDDNGIYVELCNVDNGWIRFLELGKSYDALRFTEFDRKLIKNI